MSPGLRALPLLVLLACAARPEGRSSARPSPGPRPEDAEQVDAADTGEDPWLIEDSAEPEPDLDPITGAMSEAALALRTFDPGWLFDTYAMVQAYGDESCPHYNPDPHEYWAATCVTTGGEQPGTSFSGSAISYSYGRTYRDGVDYSRLAGFVAIDASIIDPSGDELRLVGEETRLGVGVDSADGAELFSVALDGSFHWDGAVPGLDEGEQTWLSLDTLSQGYTLVFRRDPLTETMTISIDGAISGLPEALFGDLPVESAYFEGFFLDLRSDSTCALEPGGMVGVRAEGEDWLYARFDGPTSAGVEVSAEDCDGCGLLYRDGMPIGQVCPDFSALADWTESPWEDAP